SFASHSCQVGNDVIVTNACNSDEIYFCSEDICWHAGGCVPCEGGKCWERIGVTLSIRNESVRLTSMLPHIDGLLMLCAACDALGIGEVCGVGVLVFETTYHLHSVSRNFSCNCDCHLLETPKSASAISFSVVSSYFKDLTWVTSLFAEVPGAVLQLVGGGHLGVLFALLYYGLGPAPLRAVLVLLLFLTASQA
nr:envelope protein E1 [Hepacivirus otomopis]YP_009664184.1 envelope protein E1 [Bat hepacivirus]